MPRQHTHHSRIVYLFTEDFPLRPVRFKEESGLSWAELHRRLGADPETIRRWREKGVRPSTQHFAALLGGGGLLRPGPPVHRLGRRPRPTTVGPETR